MMDIDDIYLQSIILNSNGNDNDKKTNILVTDLLDENKLLNMPNFNEDELTYEKQTSIKLKDEINDNELVQIYMNENDGNLTYDKNNGGIIEDDADIYSVSNIGYKNQDNYEKNNMQPKIKNMDKSINIKYINRNNPDLNYQYINKDNYKKFDSIENNHRKYYNPHNEKDLSTKQKILPGNISDNISVQTTSLNSKMYTDAEKQGKYSYDNPEFIDNNKLIIKNSDASYGYTNDNRKNIKKYA